MKFLSVVLLPFIIFSPNVCAYYSLEGGLGVNYNLPTHLTIYQQFKPDLDFLAHYDSRTLRNPFYYDLRFGSWSDCKAWELETIHHKIYLQNCPREVGNFSISHGYNLFYVNRAIFWHGLYWRLGGGFVLAHPESTVRGLQFNEKGGTFNNNGYYLAGASGQFSIAKRFYFKQKFFVETEGRITASSVQVNIAQGDAVVPNIAAHFNLGLGYDFRSI